jgi:hypothetical protein
MRPLLIYSLLLRFFHFESNTDTLLFFLLGTYTVSGARDP